MSTRCLLLFIGLLLVSGCLYHAQERAFGTLEELTFHPFDLGPPAEVKETAPLAKSVGSPAAFLKDQGTDVETTALMQADKDMDKVREITSRLKVPEDIPGAETRPIQLPKDPVERHAAVVRLYPPLPPVPEEPKAQPGPDGCPYTLAALQQLAAVNSPTLAEAAYNVEQARGNWIQAQQYPNPTVGYQYQPSNDGSTSGAQGPFIDQVIQTSGKLKLAAAAAEMDLRNAELALKRARSDLATQVRNAYYAHLVAKETVRVNKALAHFTDEVYRIQAELLDSGFAAAYEPFALRAQARTVRVALKVAIDTYNITWMQLATAVGLRQLPLTEVAGRIDRAIPYYDYDTVKAHVLKNHTDMLTAFNGVDRARYLLKAAQVTPIPNVEFNIALLKEHVLAPKQVTPTATVSFPLPIWDQNKGATYAAEAGLGTAKEEPHRVELVLSNSLETAYLNYKTNLETIEDYRKFILPDQVRYYRGVYERRRADPSAAFGDLVQAQQTLASNVATYLANLAQMWSAVVSVADLLQTDDLFQLGKPHELPELPDLDHLPPWLCHHPCAAQPLVDGFHEQAAPVPAPAVPAERPTLPRPRPLNPPAVPQPEGQRLTPAPENKPDLLLPLPPTAPK
jgi:cobalt-zinc-cadmium efflux system outer membrane protein